MRSADVTLTPLGAGYSALSARAVERTHQALVYELRAAGYVVRTVRTWDHLLAAHGHEPDAVPDVILVDFDGISQCADGGSATVSGHRLVTLLGRQIARQATALVVLTELDFAEIEELVKLGVHAFLSPRQTISSCLDTIHAAVERRRAPHGRRGQPGKPGEDRVVVPVVVPVLTPRPRDEALVIVHGVTTSPTAAHA